jgi:hypothetical protein
MRGVLRLWRGLPIGSRSRVTRWGDEAGVRRPNVAAGSSCGSSCCRCAPLSVAWPFDRAQAFVSRVVRRQGDLSTVGLRNGPVKPKTTRCSGVGVIRIATCGFPACPRSARIGPRSGGVRPRSRASRQHRSGRSSTSRAGVVHRTSVLLCTPGKRSAPRRRQSLSRAPFGAVHGLCGLRRPPGERYLRPRGRTAE